MEGEATGPSTAPGLLTLTKANSRSTVHRPSYLDYVGVKRFDEDGNVIGERRFLGLYTHTAYRASPAEIPILRRKVAAVLERAGFPLGEPQREGAASRSSTPTRATSCSRSPATSCSRWRWGSSTSGERQRLRLFARRDPFGRFFSLLVFVPRDRFNTENRRRIEAILRNATSAASIDYTTRVSESVLVRLHFTAYVEPGLMPDFDEREVEMMLVAATRSWADDLQEALVDELGEERGGGAVPPLRRGVPGRLPRGLGGALGARGHRAHRGARPSATGSASASTARSRPARGCCGRSCSGPGRALTLSDVLPLFENMGVEVADERPYPIVPRGADGVWIYDFGLTYSGAGNLDTDGVREGFQDAFVRAWRGDVENDGYNRLVLGAALTWREITVLRAIGKYLRQARITFSDSYVRAGARRATRR